MNDTENSENQAETATEVIDTGEMSRIEVLEKDIAELKDKHLRALAEADNIRRRGEREREDIGKFAISKFAQNLLPVADSLRRAVEAIPEQHDHELLRKVVEGIEATERALLAAFEKAGIKKIEAMDKPFDANFHEVMIETDSPDKPPGTVVQIFETGYMIQERLLRPARVAVAKGGPRERLDTSA